MPMQYLIHQGSREVSKEYLYILTARVDHELNRHHFRLTRTVTIRWATLAMKRLRMNDRFIPRRPHVESKEMYMNIEYIYHGAQEFCSTLSGRHHRPKVRSVDAIILLLRRNNVRPAPDIRHKTHVHQCTLCPPNNALTTVRYECFEEAHQTLSVATLTDMKTVA